MTILAPTRTVRPRPAYRPYRAGVERIQRLSPHFTLDLSYREAHAGASSVNGGSLFKDVERYATLRLFGVL